MGETPEQEDQGSAGWLVLRSFLYAGACGGGVFVACRRTVSAVMKLEELGVELPQISIMAIELARFDWMLGVLVFVLSFGTLALIGLATRSKTARILGLGAVMTLAATLGVGMIWAAELPLNQAKAAMSEEEAAEPPKKR